MSPDPAGRTIDVSVGHNEEAAMPVGEIFLYGIWAVLALGAIIASAMAFREH